MTEPTKRFDEWKRRQAQSRGEGGGGAQPQRRAPQDRPQREPQQYREQPQQRQQPQREPQRQQYREQPQQRPAQQPQQYRERAPQREPQREPQQFTRQQRQFSREQYREPQRHEPQREPQQQYREPRAARPQQYREPQAQPQPRPQQRDPQQYREQPRPAQQYQDEPDARDLLQQQPQPQQEQPQQSRYGEVDESAARDSARSRLDRFRQMYNSNQQEKSQSSPSGRDSDRPAPREDFAPREDTRDSYYDDGYSDGYSSDYSDSGYSAGYDDYADSDYGQDYSDEYDNDYYTAGDERSAQAVTDARDNLDDVDEFDDWDDSDTDDADTGDMYPVRQSNFADMDALDEQEDKEVETDNKSGGLLGWLRRLTGRGSSSGADTSEAVASMNRKLRQPQVIGIMGSKGGVGKTSKTQVLGSILAHYRTEGGVAAVDMDANSTLIDRMKPQTEIPDNASVHTFAHDDSIRSAADVNSYLVLNEEKLAVLAGIGRTGSAPLKKDELQRILDRLGEFYTLIILDFPGSAEVPVALHALKVIDSMVYVAEITKSSLSATKRDLKRISQVRPELLSSATIILNHRTSGKVHIKNLEGHVEDFRNMGTRDVSTGASRVKVWETNYDPHIGIEGPIQISQLDPVNRTRYMQIAASIMDALPGTMPGYKRYAADHQENQRTEVHELDD